MGIRRLKYYFLEQKRLDLVQNVSLKRILVQTRYRIYSIVNKTKLAVLNVTIKCAAYTQPSV